MNPILVAIIVGTPLALFAAAIGLMIWRAIHPSRNRIHGLTDRKGFIVNPSIHLGISIFCMLVTLVCLWRLTVAWAPAGSTLTQFKGRLDILALLSISVALAIQFFQQYKKFKKSSSKANA
jgi:hypothetical protein